MPDSEKEAPDVVVPPVVSAAPAFDVGGEGAGSPPGGQWSAPPGPGQWAAPPPPFAGSPGSGLETLIPTANPPALIGYYFGLFGAFCFILAPVGLILGLKGLKKIKENPNLPGKVHAWVGVIGGAIGSALLIPTVILIVYGVIQANAAPAPLGP